MKKSKLVRETTIFELEDHGQLKIPAVMLVRGDVPRNAQGLSARLAHQFLNQNLGILRNFEIKGDVQFDGSAVYIQLHAGGQVGALPLLSPTSGRPDYGLVIKPRFGWQGIGPMLGSMGWKVIPIPLRLPLLPRSDRKIPPWVLSTTILLRTISNLSITILNYLRSLGQVFLCSEPFALHPFLYITTRNTGH